MIQLSLLLPLCAFILCAKGQIAETPNYFCSESNFTAGFTLSSSFHSARQSSSNCSLSSCSVNASNNNSCRLSSTPCFDYRTVSNVSYCAPGALCSLLVPCDNITGGCASNAYVCIINSCCAQQAVCLPLFLTSLCSSGNGTLFSSSSNNTWTIVASMVIARVAHTSTFIPETNSVLITGGDSNSNHSWIASLSTETFLSSNESFVLRTNMREARALHTADRLESDEILIAGGSNTSNAEIFDPLLGITNRTVRMSAPRIEHKSALIDYGGVKRVLLVGGYYRGAMDISPTGDIYNNVTDTFEPVSNNMSSARVGHTATAIPNGIAVIAGGFSETFTPLDSIDIYNSTSNIFVPLSARLLHARAYHTATYIPSIQAILFAGGESNYTSLVVLQTYELLDIPSLTIIRNGTLLAPKTAGTATLLLNGEVLIVEGYNGLNDTIMCALYNPITDLWRAAASLAMPRDGHTATLLENSGQVLVCGGVIQPSYTVLDECELYDP